MRDTSFREVSIIENLYITKEVLTKLKYYLRNNLDDIKDDNILHITNH